MPTLPSPDLPAIGGSAASPRRPAASRPVSIKQEQRRAEVCGPAKDDTAASGMMILMTSSWTVVSSMKGARTTDKPIANPSRHNREIFETKLTN